MHTAEFSALIEATAVQLGRAQAAASQRYRAAKSLAAGLLLPDPDLLRKVRAERQRGLEGALLAARLWALRGHVLEPLEFWGPNRVAPESAAELHRCAAAVVDLCAAVAVDVDPAIDVARAAPTVQG